MSAEPPGVMIRRARQEARMTQRQLADRMGVHHTTVGYWERGKFFPEQHWAALNKLLHISLMPPGEGPAKAPEPEPDVLAEELGQDKAERVRRVLARRGAAGEIALHALEEALTPPADASGHPVPRTAG